MQAALLESLGNWNVTKVPAPECGENDVIVQIKRSGICSTDVLRSMRTGFYHYPIIPGHEFCGVVVEKGRNVGTVNVDDRVAVYPLIPCKICLPCKRGQYNLCKNYNFLGSRRDGGYAEYVSCPKENLVNIPEGISFEQASLTEPYAVTLHAYKLAGTRCVSKVVAIMGLGPIGLAAAQWGKVFGAKTIIGIEKNEYRLKLGKEIGINHIVNTKITKASDAIKELTDGEGANIIFECSGSNELQTQSILAAAKSGKMIILGNPFYFLTLDEKIYSLILRNELTIAGSWSSLISPENEWKEVLQFMKEGKINPSQIITHRVPLSKAKQVIEDMYFEKFEFSKVVFEP